MEEVLCLGLVGGSREVVREETKNIFWILNFKKNNQINKKNNR